MTPDEFRATLKRLGLRQRWLAERLGVFESTVSGWARGTYPVPQYAVAYLRALEMLADRGVDVREAA